MRGYVICATPRSGSNYLLSLLASTGVLGRPLEWFNPDVVRKTGFADWRAGPAAMVARFLAHGATPSGVYGLKVFPWQFDRMAAAGVRWAENLAGVSFVHLTRHDLLGQAISYARATQTEAWTSADRAGRAPEYDGVAIAALMQEIAEGDARWRAWFARNGLEPLRLTYEAVAAAPRLAVERIAASVGVTRFELDPAAVDVAIQRDPLTAEWRTRFLSERRDLGAL